LPSYFGISGLASARVACTSKSRLAISRFRGSRRSLEGQVARIRRIGVSAFGVSNSRELCVEDSRSAKSRSDVAEWGPKERRIQVASDQESVHRGSGFGVWRGKCFVTCQIANRDFPS
jgi:hypothetical protein